MIAIVRYRLDGEEFIPEYVDGPVEDINGFKRWLDGIEGYDLLLSTKPRFSNTVNTGMGVVDDESDPIIYEKRMWGDKAAFVLVQKTELEDMGKFGVMKPIDVLEVHLITLFQLDDTDFVDMCMFDNAIDALKEIPIMKGRL